MSASVERDCVIAGGGPAGMMLGHLLARAGFRVTVLEKHADFLRDFRGDTIHPSTIAVLGEVGLREAFLALPLSRVDGMDLVVDGDRLSLVDFSTLPGPDDFLVFAPQWDLLDFLARESARFAGFELRMSTEAVEAIESDGRIVGVRAAGPDGVEDLHAALVVAADGRGSRLREAAGFAPVADGVPIDVLWFDLPRPADSPPPTLGYLDGRGMVLTLDRGTRYQSGLVIPKGGFDALRAAGLPALRSTVAAVAPPLASVVDTLTDWAQVKLLSVQIDHLPRWSRDGFVAIGDAAHAMSPVGGVGVNYAIQDAVALANAISPVLGSGSVPLGVLEAVERRRMPAVHRMQAIQQRVHARLAAARPGIPVLPRAARAVLRFAAPVVRHVAARVIGLGFRPEHVASGPAKG